MVVGDLKGITALFVVGDSKGIKALFVVGVVFRIIGVVVYAIDCYDIERLGFPGIGTLGTLKHHC